MEKAPRFVVETVEGREQIRINAQRKLFILLFLPVWLAIWSFGGVSATRAFATTFQPFLLLWLVGWAVGWVFAGVTLGWMLTGSEILRVIGSDLEVSYRLLGFTRRKLYRGGDIRDLSASENQVFSRYNQIDIPFLIASKSGCLRFSYGARTIYVGSGLDRSEGQLIVERLRRRLPAAATATA